MLRTEKLRKRYISKTRAQIEALKSLDLSFEDTGLTCIVGKSGCGKTTLLNCMSGLDTPTDGKVFYSDGLQDICITDLHGNELDEFRNRYIGIIFQDYNLINEWTVEENLKIVLDIRNGLDENESEKKIEEVLGLVELSEVRKRPIKELSGGQQQRIAIARALIKEPQILFCDEPTGNLDSQNSEMIMQILKKASEKIQVIVVTHDNESAEKFADRILKISDGTIIEDRRNVNSQTDSKEEKTGLALPETKRLGQRSILKISLNNLRMKKLKIFFMMLVMIIIFAIIKLSLSLMYLEKGKALSEFLSGNKLTYLYLAKNEKYSDLYSVDEGITIRNDRQSYSEISELFGKENIYPMLRNIYIKNDDNILSCNMVIGGESDDYEISGSLPQGANEVVITDYMADELGLSDPIGKEVTVAGCRLKISGLIILNYTYDDYGNPVEYSEAAYRILASKSFGEYYAECANVELPFSSVSTNYTIDEEKEIFIDTASVSGSTDYEIISGRAPESDDEIAVSEDYLYYCMMCDTIEETEDLSYGYTNIYDETYNGIFNGYLNLYDYLPNVRIVGVYESGAADIILNDSIYKKILSDYTENFLHNSYEIKLSNAAIKDQSIFDKLLEEDYQFEIDYLEPLLDKFEEISAYKTLLQLATLIMSVILFLLLIIFFSFNVKDNYKKIGILKSMGVTNRDINKIWIIESVIVAALTYVFSLIAELVIIVKINNKFIRVYNYVCSYIYKNVWIDLAELFALILLTVLLVLMPLWLLTDKKTIELIKS
jgi:ABC-type lipoprotein export system ATPase subunit